MAYFDDNTTMSIYWNLTQTPGCAIKGISYDGIQNEIKIVDQVIDTYSPTTGTINSSDTIVQAISKIGSTLPNNYSGIHITSGSSGTTNLTSLERGVIFDSGVTGKTVKLPLGSSAEVIPWVPYPFLVAPGVITSNTIGVQTGDYLNNTINGTYTIAGLLSGWVWVNALWDGSRWFIAP